MVHAGCPSYQKAHDQGPQPVPRYLDRLNGRDTELAGLEGLQPVTARDLQNIQREVATRLADWQGLLTRQVAQSRQILKKLLVGRIVFQPRDDGTYEFSGQASLGRIIAWLACTKAVVAPTGHGLFTHEFRDRLAA